LHIQNPSYQSLAMNPALVVQTEKVVRPLIPN
jgi:hypothetical protein